jgi:hypothetical protein
MGSGLNMKKDATPRRAGELQGTGRVGKKKSSRWMRGAERPARGVCGSLS